MKESHFRSNLYGKISASFVIIYIIICIRFKIRTTHDLFFFVVKLEKPTCTNITSKHTSILLK